MLYACCRFLLCKEILLLVYINSFEAKQSLIKFAAKNRRIPIYLVNTTTVQILTRQRKSFSHLRAAILFDKRKKVKAIFKMDYLDLLLDINYRIRLMFWMNFKYADYTSI